MKFLNRRSDRLTLLPLIAGALALLLWLRDAQAETIKGLTQDGRAYVCERFQVGPLLEFCVYFTRERR